MSLAWFMVTTDASRPSATERACLLEPPCDCLMVMVSPVLAFQSAINAGFTSLNSSRITSYEAFSKTTGSAALAAIGRLRAAAEAARALARNQRRERWVSVAAVVDTALEWGMLNSCCENR
ncbi:hypothetical protein D3C72_1988530 [compost metagenome]